MKKDTIALKNKNKEMYKNWKRFIKKEEFFDYFSFYKAIKNTAESMALQMIDFLFLDDIYTAFLELLELTNNIEIMLNTKSYETMQLCKQRVDYFLQNRIENWYL